MNAAMPNFAARAINADVLPLLAVLGQIQEVLSSVDDDQYVMKPVGVVASSLGAHVRHSLDHVEALIAGLDSGTVDYDRRTRGTRIETSRSDGIEKTLRLMDRLSRLADVESSSLVYVRVVPDPDSEAVFHESTFGREIAFVVNHSIHHNALIDVIAKTLRVPVPYRFGYAPSTVQYMERHRCAL